MVYLKGIKIIPRPQEFYCAGTTPPGFEIPGSATGKLFKIPYTVQQTYIGGLRC